MITAEVLLDASRQPAKNQGNRPTCLAFAISDLNRQFAPEDLGPEFFTARLSPIFQDGSQVMGCASLRPNMHRLWVIQLSASFRTRLKSRRCPLMSSQHIWSCMEKLWDSLIQTLEF